MKIRIVIAVLAVVCLTGYLAVPPVPDAPPETAALTGVWQGMRPDDLPARLVVQGVRGNWATVLYNWGDHPDGTFQRGWVRVRALVLPDGKLFWRHPGDFTFQLSEDWTTLVGKREQGGRTATSLMRRVPAATALSALSTEEIRRTH